MQKLNLQILRQINDHDGYCSDAENEYTEETLIYYVDIPEEYRLLPVGTNITNMLIDKELFHIAPAISRELYPTVYKDCGFGYCGVGEGAKYDLGVHDFRLTIISATIVDI